MRRVAASGASGCLFSGPRQTHDAVRIPPGAAMLWVEQRMCLAERRPVVGWLRDVALLSFVLAAYSSSCLAEATKKRHAATPDLTVTRPNRPLPAPLQPIPPLVPPPVSVTPGYPVTPFDASIIDDTTRFLTKGPAEARCPGQEIVFVFGVVSPTRPTAPGDGAYMCRGDAVAEGYLSPYR
jgi:hypothetical protein